MTSYFGGPNRYAEIHLQEIIEEIRNVYNDYVACTHAHRVGRLPARCLTVHKELYKQLSGECFSRVVEDVDPDPVQALVRDESANGFGDPTHREPWRLGVTSDVNQTPAHARGHMLNPITRPPPDRRLHRHSVNTECIK